MKLAQHNQYSVKSVDADGLWFGTRASVAVVLSTDPCVSSRSGLKNFVHGQTATIRRTKSPNSNISRLVTQLSLPNPLKPGIQE